MEEHKLEWCVRDHVGRNVEIRERRANVWGGSLLGKQRAESRRDWVLARVWADMGDPLELGWGRLAVAREVGALEKDWDITRTGGMGVGAEGEKWYNRGVDTGVGEMRGWRGEGGSVAGKRSLSSEVGQR